MDAVCLRHLTCRHPSGNIMIARRASYSFTTRSPLQSRALFSLHSLTPAAICPPPPAPPPSRTASCASPNTSSYAIFFTPICFSAAIVDLRSRPSPPQPQAPTRETLIHPISFPPSPLPPHLSPPTPSTFLLEIGNRTRWSYPSLHDHAVPRPSPASECPPSADLTFVSRVAGSRLSFSGPQALALLSAQTTTIALLHLSHPILTSIHKVTAR